VEIIAEGAIKKAARDKAKTEKGTVKAPAKKKKAAKKKK